MEQYFKNIYSDKEFIGLVKDILTNEKFIQMKDYKQHVYSLYYHSLGVSYRAYKICKFLRVNKTNTKRTVRGALLHDFYLYDWRNCKNWHIIHWLKSHACMHPKIAAKNANEIFGIDKIEKDIIIKHMWPVTLKFPRYKETLIVNIADKTETIIEYFQHFKDKSITNFELNEPEYWDL